MNTEYISIKDFAQKNNRSVQSVYQQINRKANAELLEGHIVLKEIKKRKIKFLDNYAVQLLNESRNNNPAVILNVEDKEQIESLKQENKNLLIKIAEQADRLSFQSEELLGLKTRLIESTTKNENAENQIKEAEEKIKELEEKLKMEETRKLSFKERFFGKKSK